MHARDEKHISHRSSTTLSLSDNAADEETGLRPQSTRTASEVQPEEETELQTRPNSLSEGSSPTQRTATAGNFIQRKSSQLFDALSSSPRLDVPVVLPPELAELVQAYADSNVAAELLSEVARLKQTGGAVLLESGGRVRASWITQFRILSGRAFKNLYRDPALLLAHYLSSVGVACELKSSLSTLLLADLLPPPPDCSPSGSPPPNHLPSSSHCPLCFPLSSLPSVSACSFPRLFLLLPPPLFPLLF